MKPVYIRHAVGIGLLLSFFMAYSLWPTVVTPILVIIGSYYVGAGIAKFSLKMWPDNS